MTSHITKPLAPKMNGGKRDPRIIRGFGPRANRAAKGPLVKSENQLFMDGGDFLGSYIREGMYPYVEKLRQASFNGDWATLFAMRPWNTWGPIPLGKFRFAWVNGKPLYKPMSKQDYRNYFSGPWINITGEFGGVCTEERINTYTNDYYGRSLRNVREGNPKHPHYIRRDYPQNIICRPKQKSTWVKIRNKVYGAAAIVTAVYLGPAILGKIKALSAAKGAGAAVTGGKVLAGSQKLVGAVNQGRTINAIVKGKLPPPPVSIKGASWREWAFLVAKEEMIKKGQQVGAAEEAAMRAEIAQMQRELVATTPVVVQQMPAQPVQQLAPVVQRIQTVEENRKTDLDKLILPAALIAGALILGG